MVKFIIICIAITTLSNSHVLSQHTLTGIVLSKSTKEPIPFATITTNKHNSGICADKEGAFTYKTDASDSDTLLISCVGYETEKIVIELAKNTRSFYLSERIKNLSPVSIHKSTNETILGSVRDTPTNYFHSSPKGNLNQIALLITPDKQTISSYIKSVGFCISEGGIPTTPFRVRIYNVNQGAPGDDLLIDNVITSGKRKGGWLDVDISPYNLQLPAEGVFVAMEWIYIDNPKYFQKVYRIERINQKKILDKKNATIEYNYGQHLCLTDEFNQPISYTRTDESAWKLYGKGFIMSQRIFSPMVRLTILID